jgi:hypothetical protein
LAVLPLTPEWLIATASGVTGALVFWTLASVLPNLDVLVQFMGLQFDASDVPDLPSATDPMPETQTEEQRRSASV